jgi:cytoskeletal protein RodZ
MVEDLYADDLYEEEEEALVEGEGTNRTFIMLAGGLGGLLALAICVFAVWAFVINPRMTNDRVAQNAAIEQTNEAIQAANGGAASEETATETPVPAATDAPEPTATPVPPTNTPRPTATPKPPTPMPEEGEVDLTAEAEATPAEGEATATPAQVAEAPVSSKATAAPTQPSSKQGVPETGVGTLGIGVLAIGLLFLLVVVRRVRRAV